MARKRVRKRQLKHTICITIDPDLLAKARRIAKRERRSLSSFLGYLVDLEWRKMKAEEKAAPVADPRTNSELYRLLSREDVLP